jgi:hypothetical protein
MAAFKMYMHLETLNMALETCDYSFVNKILYNLGDDHGKWAGKAVDLEDEDVVEKGVYEFNKKIDKLIHEISLYFKNVCGMEIRPVRAGRPDV